MAKTKGPSKVQMAIANRQNFQAVCNRHVALGELNGLLALTVDPLELEGSIQPPLTTALSLKCIGCISN